MIEEKIQRKRKELDESIQNNNKYEEVYKLSVELDDLITEFYKESSNKKNNTKNILKNKKSLRKILYIA